MPDFTAPFDLSPHSVLRHLGPGERNKTVQRFSAEVDGQPVPFIDITCWPAESFDCHAGTQVYLVYENDEPRWELPAGPSLSRTMPHDFEPAWVWTVSVDHRIAHDFASQDEAERAISLVADVAALEGGFTSAGRSHYKTADGGVPVVNDDVEMSSPTGDPVSCTLEGAPIYRLGKSNPGRIPDPMVKTKLPTNLLHAISKCWTLLDEAVDRTQRLADVVGGPDDTPFGVLRYGNPQSALDFSRDSAQLATMLLDNIERLEKAVGDT